MKSMYELGVSVPTSTTQVVRNIKETSKQQRERVLKETEYLMFSFPADMLVLDFLSDSGYTTMTDLQWASLFHGDESYGRNRGYYVLLDTIRDVFERGDNPNKVINLILAGESDVEKLINTLYLPAEEGGFVNGGINQLKRPNAFITPQGRCAEFLLYSTLKEILSKHFSGIPKFWIPNNGHFDTTGANISSVGIEPVNLFKTNILDPFPYTEMSKQNPFKGDMDTDKLRALIKEKGRDAIPLIVLTITNNTVAGQPVSMKNIKEVNAIAAQHQIPFFFDACRFAENAYFIKTFEQGYEQKSIPEIVKEMFSYVDGFTISFKKDGHSDIGGGLFFKDNGCFHKRFSFDEDIGIKLKEKQIITFGNDSYGGLSGRDIMALSVGLREVTKCKYLDSRIKQVQYLAHGLAANKIPVVLPAGGHAVYIDMDKFFEGTSMKIDDFGGLGLCIELVRHYGIRACELGPFAFEWDQKTPEQRKGILNLVRFAVPRNLYSKEHIDYTVAAVTELFHHKDQIPRAKISRGAQLRLRHFQSGIEPIYTK